MRSQHDDVRKQLDHLRRTRSARGLGPPLQQPKHLQQPIIFTDADLKNEG